MPVRPYTPTSWSDVVPGGDPGSAPPISAANLNHIEQAIDQLDTDLATAELTLATLVSGTNNYTPGNLFSKSVVAVNQANNAVNGGSGILAFGSDWDAWIGRESLAKLKVHNDLHVLGNLTVDGSYPAGSYAGSYPIVNADISATAAIAYSKLSLTSSIVNADISASAAIAWTKISKTGSSLADLVTRSASDLTSGTVPVARLPVFVASGASHAAGAVPDPGATAGTTKFLREDATWVTPSGAYPGSYPIVNADVAAAAAIAYSKLSLTGSIVNGDIAAGANISYAKLSLGSSIVNADIAAGAGIAYSKLSLSTSIVNADISTTAAIAYSKLNLSTSIVNADISATAAIAYSKLNLASAIVNADISATAAIAYSKLNLASAIVNTDVSASAAIAWSKISKTGSSLADLTTRSAADLSSGILPVARLPIFVASGASHAAGAVPDPGATAGTTKYLREDATWAVPPGGGSVPDPLVLTSDITARSAQSTQVKIGAVGPSGQAGVLFGSTGALDTNLYLATDDRVKTDGILQAGGSVFAGDVVLVNGSDNVPSGGAGKLFFGSAWDSSVWRLSSGLLATEQLATKNGPVRDIRAYGAVAGAADNTSAVNAAFAASSAGDTVLFPPGVWNCTSDIIPKDGVNWLGRGDSADMGSGSVVNGRVNWGTTDFVGHCEVRGICFKNTTANNTGQCWLWQAQMVHIDVVRCAFWGATTGTANIIHCDKGNVASGGFTCEPIRFIRCQFNNGYSAFYYKARTAGEFSKFTFRSCRFDNWRATALVIDTGFLKSGHLDNLTFEGHGNAGCTAIRINAEYFGLTLSDIYTEGTCGTTTGLTDVDINGKLASGDTHAELANTTAYTFGSPSFGHSLVWNGGMLLDGTTLPSSATNAVRIGSADTYPGNELVAVTVNQAANGYSVSLGKNTSTKACSFQAGNSAILHTAVKAGAWSDTDFDEGGGVVKRVASGAMAIDTTNSKLYIRFGSTWKSVTLT